MKRILTTVVFIMSFIGVLSAQEQITLHWGDFNSNTQYNTSVIGHVWVDGVRLDSDTYEIGAFVGNECRGASLLYHDQIPGYWIQFAIHFETSGETATFKLYDHSENLEMDLYCANSLTLGPETVGGIDGNSAYVVNFYTPFYKEITGHDGNDASGWSLISSPVGALDPANVGNLVASTVADFDLYRFNQSADAEWENWKKEGDHYHFNLEPGRGYLYANKNTVNLRFGGVPYDGNGEVNLIYDSGKDFAGWNLIGNPFPTEAYIDRPYYKMTDDGDGFLEVNENYASTPIPVCTGILVKAGGTGEKVTFTQPSDKPGQEPGRGNLRVVVAEAGTRSEAMLDKAVVSFNENDRIEKFVFNESRSKLYIPQGDKDYAIAYSERRGETPLCFKATKSGSYTVTVTPQDVEMEYLHLIDNLTGANVDLLAMPSYTFEAGLNDYASRFRLVYWAESENAELTGEEFAYISNGEIIVNGTGTLQVVDLLGHILLTREVTSHSSLLTPNSPGVYLLRLIDGDQTKTQKIIKE